jgi:hypothetical protein
MATSHPSFNEQIISLLLSNWQLKSLGAVAELGIADLLADGPVSIDELANKTNTDSSALFRILRALESVGIFTQVSPRVFANSTSSEFLRKDVPESQHHVILAHSCRGYTFNDAWEGISDVVKTGKPGLDLKYGFDLWELCRRKPEVGVNFNESVRTFGDSSMASVAGAFDWTQFPVIADIGGGTGKQLMTILDKAPNSRGILFDQSHLSKEVMSHDRMEFVPGNFFQKVPSGADLYILRWIIHDWPWPQKKQILKCMREAMKRGARVILVEALIPDGPEFSLSKWLDLEVMAAVGGDELTQAEYQTLFDECGFRLEQVISTPTPLNLLVASLQ